MAWAVGVRDFVDIAEPMLVLVRTCWSDINTKSSTSSELWILRRLRSFSSLIKCRYLLSLAGSFAVDRADQSQQSSPDYL